MTDKIKNWENRLSSSLTGLINNITENLRDGDIFYDIGANTGLFTKTILDKNRNIKCVLFEPVKEYYDEIEKKFQDDPNVIEYFNLALLDESKIVPISIDADNLGWNTISEIAKYGNIELVDAFSLSDLYKEYPNLPRPTVMKIDVEQSEHLLVEGMQLYYDEHKDELPRLIYMEIGITPHHRLWEKEVRMFEYLFSVGYKRFDYNKNHVYDAVFELS